MSKWVHCLKCFDYALVEEESPDFEVPHPEVLEDLERYRRKYEAGGLSSLPAALGYCIDNYEPIPDWLRGAFRKARKRVWSHEVGSWDDVFGKPLKKGQQRRAAHRRAKITEALAACNGPARGRRESS
jgi:hypothetical protein